VYNDAARGDDEFPATWLAPQFDGEHRPLFEDPRLDEAELDRELRSRAREYALDHPAYVLKATALNTLRMFELVDARGETSYESGGTDDAAPAWLLDLARWSAWAMIALALAGAGLLVRARGRLPAGPAFLWLVPILMLAAAVPISGGARYRAPLDPFLALLAAIALAAAWDRVVERRRAHPAQ
jgi:hypothetical protein